MRWAAMVHRQERHHLAKETKSLLFDGQRRPKKKLDKRIALFTIDSVHGEDRFTMTMERVNLYLADLQVKRLEAIDKKTGLPFSDILRRAIDEYWERFEKKGKKVETDKRRNLELGRRQS